MKEEHAELAGEMSGHMFFADRYYGFDDALYAACRLIEIVARLRPAALRATGRAAQDGRPRRRCAWIAPTRRSSRWSSASWITSARSGEVIDVDGARVLFDGGWGLVRASNTQPVLVMRFEATQRRTAGRLPQGSGRRGGESEGGLGHLTNGDAGVRRHSRGGGEGGAHPGALRISTKLLLERAR